MARNPVVYTVLIQQEIERDETIPSSTWDRIVNEVRDEAERLLPLQIRQRILEEKLESLREEIGRG